MNKLEFKKLLTIENFVDIIEGLVIGIMLGIVYYNVNWLSVG